MARCFFAFWECVTLCSCSICCIEQQLICLGWMPLRCLSLFKVSLVDIWIWGRLSYCMERSYYHISVASGDFRHEALQMQSLLSGKEPIWKKHQLLLNVSTQIMFMLNIDNEKSEYKIYCLFTMPGYAAQSQLGPGKHNSLLTKCYFDKNICFWSGSLCWCTHCLHVH